jgi:hypothetical protein
LVQQPEQEARKAIDQLVTQAVWKILDANHVNPIAARDSAINCKLVTRRFSIEPDPIGCPLVAKA